MGNAHGHRKNRNDHNYSSSSYPTPVPPYYNYGPPPHQPQPQPQVPSSMTQPQMALSLPYTNVDFSLRALAGQAEGFGRFAIGGLHGPLYHVATLAGKVTRLSISFCTVNFFLA